MISIMQIKENHTSGISAEEFCSGEDLLDELFILAVSEGLFGSSGEIFEAFLLFESGSSLRI